MTQVGESFADPATADSHAPAAIGIDFSEQFRRSWMVIAATQDVVRRLQDSLGACQAAVDYSRQQVNATREVLKSFAQPHG